MHAWKTPVYLHSMLAASLPSHSLRSSKGISLSVHRVKTNTGARAFHSCAPSLRHNLPLSVRSAISVATFKKYLKTHFFDLAFPLRHGHTWQLVDVTELFHQVCCWTLIQLSRHWAWLAGDICTLKIWLINEWGLLLAERGNSKEFRWLIANQNAYTNRVKKIVTLVWYCK